VPSDVATSYARKRLLATGRRTSARVECASCDDNVDPSDWFDPAVLEGLAARASRFTLKPDDVRTQDFTLK